MCGLRSAHFLARCLECGRWFCNRGADELGGSHIYRHLSETFHGAFAYPENGICAHKPVCERCGCAVATKLGFMPAWDGARVVCLDCFDYSDEAGEPIPLVLDKKFAYEALPWPAETEQAILNEIARAPSVTLGQDLEAKL